MKKIIMFLFFLVSLVTIIAFTFSINYFFSLFGLGGFDINDIISSLDNSTLEEIMPALGIILWGLFQLYGIPLVVFLVSLNGLTKE